MGMTTDTRARMITSAALLLREHGVARTSIPKVLEHSRGPRGSVGHHFPGGRSELITEALTWAGGMLTDAIASQRDAGASGAEVFAHVCDFYAGQLVSTDYAAGCPVGAAAQESYDDPTLAPLTARIIDSWTTALTEALTQDGHPTTDARSLALLCVSAVEGAILLARVARSTQPLDAVRERLLPLLTPP